MALMVYCDFVLSSLLFDFFEKNFSPLGLLLLIFFWARQIVAIVREDIMEGSLEKSGWNSSAVYEAMQRY
jgi:hypothetical protein